MLIKHSIKQKILLLVFLIILISVGCFTMLSINYTQKSEIEDIDQVLLSAAYGAKFIVGDEYHDSIEDSTSVTPEEYARIVSSLAEFVKKIDVKEVYTYIKLGGELRWTSGSLAADTFYGKYLDKPEKLQEIYFKPFRDNKPVFISYEDMYGAVRSVFIPFKTATGKTYIVGVDYSREYIKDLVSKIAVWYALLGLGILIISVSLAYFFINQISKPLKNLVSYTHELVNNNFQLTDSTQNYLNVYSSSYKDEVGKLSGAFLSMQVSLKQYIVDLRTTTIAKESMEGQLRIATAIQMSMIPNETFPGQTVFTISGFMHPAKEVGGDLYNYFMIDDDHLAFTIGDVSDKGIPAALFMAMTNTLIKAITLSGLSPAEVLFKANNELCKENEQCMFVTLLLGILNLKTGEVEFANAGHNPFIVMKGNKFSEYRKISPGMVLAAFSDVNYVNERFILNPNDTIFMYTDGVTEAMNRDHHLFGEERLLESIKKTGSLSVNDLIDETMKEVNLFVDGNEQSDDITILALRLLS
ncbi:MAG: SpoIIE family protein phosphatase [Bacteroidota bacterium]|nr:SpoIIE family protein phosphatase [Bacteroidota bacterium]